jgi:hypothetical protein
MIKYKRERWVENLKERGHSEDLRVDGRIKTVWNCVDWIHLAQEKAQWRDLTNKVMNLRVP